MFRADPAWRIESGCFCKGLWEELQPASAESARSIGVELKEESGFGCSHSFPRQDRNYSPISGRAEMTAERLAELGTNCRGRRENRRFTRTHAATGINARKSGRETVNSTAERIHFEPPRGREIGIL